MPSKALILFVSFLSAGALAAPPDRVPARVDDSRRVYLNGHVHAKAQPQYDQGAVKPSLQLTHLTLNFSRSDAQQADLDQLLVDLQSQSSGHYHQWLTPEQFGARFGLSDADMAAATGWLKKQGFTVTSTARARNFVTFDGTAAMVQDAFRTELHHYLVDGELHFANASDPPFPPRCSRWCWPSKGSTIFVSNRGSNREARYRSILPRGPATPSPPTTLPPSTTSSRCTRRESMARVRSW